LRETIESAPDYKGMHLPHLENIPKNIGNKEKPDKQEAIKNMKTRFST